MRLDILFYLLISTIISIATIIYISFTVPLAFSYRQKFSSIRVNKNEITALIPVYNENVDTFKEVINSVKDNGINFIVVGDGCNQPYKEIVEKSGGVFIGLAKNGGKRNAIREGFKYVRTPYVLLLDSDTILPKEAVEKLSSKLDDKVVAVSPEISVMPGKDKNVYYISEMMQRLRELSYRALQKVGSIVSLNGQCILVKTEVIRPLIESNDFSNVRLWRFSTILGDDRQITNYIYSKGYKAIVTRDVVVKTKAPDNLKGLLRQLVRWYRSNNFFLIKEFTDGTLMKKGFFYAFTLLYWYTLPLLSLGNYLLYTEIVMRYILTHRNITVKVITKDPIKFIEYVIMRRIEDAFSLDPSHVTREINKLSHISPKFYHHHFYHRHILVINHKPLDVNIIFFYYFYNFHNLVGEISTIVSIIMVLTIILYTRKSFREFTIGMLAFPLMFFADIFALLTIWRQKKWSGRS